MEIRSICVIKNNEWKRNNVIKSEIFNIKIILWLKFKKASYESKLSEMLKLINKQSNENLSI